jgi:hypothetical protein
VVALLFFALAAYLASVGSLMLIRPGLISIAAGASLLGGLEVAGPYAFLLTGACGVLIGYGLLRLNHWARRLAIVAAVTGVVLLIPSVSSSVVALRWGQLASSGLGVVVRTIIVWYLYQLPVKDAFERNR